MRAHILSNWALGPVIIACAGAHHSYFTPLVFFVLPQQMFYKVAQKAQLPIWIFHQQFNFHSSRWAVWRRHVVNHVVCIEIIETNVRPTECRWIVTVYQSLSGGLSSADLQRAGHEGSAHNFQKGQWRPWNSCPEDASCQLMLWHTFRYFQTKSPLPQTNEAGAFGAPGDLRPRGTYPQR